MKSRLLFTAVALVVAIAMIAGGTMAWFTATAPAPAAVFTAGTVEIEAGEFAVGSETVFTKWNPGDCTTVEWTFDNVGTKAIELRTLLNKGWQPIGTASYDNWVESVHSGTEKLFNIAGTAYRPSNWNLAIRGSSDGIIPASSSFQFLNGVAQPFTVHYDGTIVTYTVNGNVMTAPFTGSADSMFITLNSNNGDRTVELENLMLNEVSLDDMTVTNGKNALLIQGPAFADGFTLTGTSTMSWTGTAPEHGALAYYVSVGTVPADIAPILSGNNVTWTLADEVAHLWIEENGYYYYIGGPIASNTSVKLAFKVCLLGEVTGNTYQGQPYGFGLNAQAIQASNNAPTEVWGFNPGPTVLTFDPNTITLAETQTADTWYKDRLSPAAFETAYFDGDNRLKHSINASDVPGTDFYQYQGRKMDTPGAQMLSIDLYIPSAWQNTSDVRAGMWATANNGNLSYPIIEFTNNPLSGSDPAPRFRVWQSNTGWVDIALPTGFVYDAWHTMSIKLDVDAEIVTYKVGDVTHVLDSQHATQIINVILQGHNLRPNGSTYDIYWDNLKIK